MAILDKNRDFGILGCGDKRFHTQDDKIFDIGTGEEVDPATIPKEKPKPVLTCKFCGAKRETPELMKEHLLALHKDDMEKAKEPQKTETPKPAPKRGRSRKGK